MKIDITIPERMSHLRMDPRGYPIPFFCPIVNGKPEFKYMDGNKLNLAIDHNLCHICGQKLNKDYHYFIAGPVGLKNQISSDAAMHRECAEYALKVCPHMFLQKAERKINDPVGITNPHIKEKPECLFLVKSSKYRAKFYPEYGYKLIHYRAVGAEKYIYEDNKLQKA